MRHDPTDIILQTIVQNSQYYCQLSYNIKHIFMNAYDVFRRIETVVYVKCD